MIGVAAIYVFLCILNLSLCALNVANGKYLLACISAIAVIWVACCVAYTLKCYFNYTKIKKSIENEYAEQRKEFDFVENQASEQWHRQIPKKQPNIYHGRIAHLAFRHKKVRVRKKNINRILKGK